MFEQLRKQTLAGTVLQQNGLVTALNRYVLALDDPHFAGVLLLTPG